MKITGFNNIIVTQKKDDVVNLFNDLGFEQTHAPNIALEKGEAQDIRMKHENGYHIDIADDVNNLPQDMTIIRMNVDNFREAYDILIAHGFKNTRGDDTLDSKSSKAATMIAPSGFAIALVEHIKKEN